uniref:Uncharacterized protein n=1 Tax=Anopheles melas TaxID=34690 RepID=A0A182UBP5_9DIPT
MTLSDDSSNELFSIGCWSSAFEAAFRKNGIASVIERTIALATPLSGTTVSACFRSSGAVGSAFRCSLATSDGWGLTVPFGITSRNSSTSPLRTRPFRPVAGTFDRLSNCSTTSPTFTYHSFTVTSRMPSPMSDR